MRSRYKKACEKSKIENHKSGGCLTFSLKKSKPSLFNVQEELENKGLKTKYTGCLT